MSSPCLPSAHREDPTPVGTPQRRRPPRHSHRPVRSDHAVGARHAAQLGRPQLVIPLGRAKRAGHRASVSRPLGQKRPIHRKNPFFS
jgi:hypothetical protein